MAGLESPAMILFGHGARDPEWRRPIDAVHRAVIERVPLGRVEIAFHEYLRPRLDEVVAALYAEGYREIVVVPVFIAQGGHLRREVPEVIETLQTRFRECRLTLEPAVGESVAVQGAIAAHCAALIDTERQKN